MPLLSAAEPLPARPRRVVVAGTSGSGKTTLAARVAMALGIRHVEIDALFHGPGWTPRPGFEAEVESFTAEPAWVTEWQYRSVRALLVERADLLLWLDLPTTVVMRQVITRTVRRRVHHQELWNGNVEPPLRTIVTDPDHIVRWAWRTRHQTEHRVRAVLRDHPDLPVVRLRSHREAESWVRGALEGA
ncbi:AAA family ATPase [Actinotalea sp. C106]|uniref:AAA family ATPase n=1 Tax=Actinotalea sp. C106 TaxID=2908644 RepID=UPI002028DF37|nr:AAA family ATPase [Actinotalea sp. C106]